MAKTGYVVVVGSKGHRRIGGGANANSVTTKAEAKKKVRMILRYYKKSARETLDYMNPRVHKVGLYKTGDPKQTYFG